MKINGISSGSKGNAYVVSDGKTNIMIECGISKSKLIRSVNLRDISAVLVSHKHKDHCLSIAHCINAGVDVFAPAEVFIENKLRGRLCHCLKELTAFDVGSFYIVPFELVHDCVNFGFFICSRVSKEKLLYFTDTRIVKHKFTGITHIMAECNHSKEALEHRHKNGNIPLSLVNRVEATHMSLDSLIRFMKANDLTHVQEIYLIHISENNGNAILFQNKIKKETGKPVYVLR